MSQPAEYSFWTDEQISFVKDHFPYWTAPKIAACVGKTASAVYQKAHALGIKKADDFLKVRAESEVHERFWAQVETVPEAGCWLWVGFVGGNGYGQFKNGCAHRVSWQMHKGEIPSGIFVCHKCDTPRCVNPDHLFLGDAAANNKDRKQKGRYSRGSEIYNAVLCEEKVREIRASKKTHRAIAKDFGISRGLVHQIRARRAWRWVSE